MEMCIILTGLKMLFLRKSIILIIRRSNNFQSKISISVLFGPTLKAVFLSFFIVMKEITLGSKSKPIAVLSGCKQSWGFQ